MKIFTAKKTAHKKEFFSEVMCWMVFWSLLAVMNLLHTLLQGTVAWLGKDAGSW